MIVPGGDWAGARAIGPRRLAGGTALCISNLEHICFWYRWSPASPHRDTVAGAQRCTLSRKAFGPCCSPSSGESAVDRVEVIGVAPSHRIAPRALVHAAGESPLVGYSMVRHCSFYLFFWPVPGLAHGGAQGCRSDPFCCRVQRHGWIWRARRGPPRLTFGSDGLGKRINGCMDGQGVHVPGSYSFCAKHTSSDSVGDHKKIEHLWNVL